MKNKARFFAAVIGFISTSAQIVFMREFLITFYGNELSVGFILFGWIIGAAGSFFLGKYADRLRNKGPYILGASVFTAFLLPSGILCVRSLKTILGINPGQMISFTPLLISAVLILAPISACLGFLFCAAVSISQEENAQKKIGRVYALESLGSGLGGIVTGLLLISFLDSFVVMSLLSFICVVSAFYIRDGEKFDKKVFILRSLSAGIVIFALSGVAGQYLIKALFNQQWKGYELLDSRNSVYGNVAAAKRQEQISFFYDGLLLFSLPDRQRQEEAVHFAMLEHRDPKNILIIGQGVGGLLGEVLKYDPDNIDYVELDPLIVKMAVQYMPNEYTAPIKDPRVHVHTTDGRYFLKYAKNKYDVILLNVGDPFTAQVNRFYTLEFFNEAKRALSDDGILSFSLGASESFIRKELADFLGVIYRTLSMSFDDTAVIPGEKAVFLASKRTGAITMDHNVLMKRAVEKKIELLYIREYYLFDRFSEDKKAYMNGILKSGAGRVNTDFWPAAYYYDIVYWSAHFRDSVFKKLLEGMTVGKLIRIFTVFFGVLILSSVFAVFRKGFFKNAVLAGLASCGFVSIAFQMVLLLSFQVIYGYVFYKMSMIIACFMAGLFLGGWHGAKFSGIRKGAVKRYLIILSGVSVYAFLSTGILLWISGTDSPIFFWFGAHLIIPVLSVISGYVTGMLYPAANGIYLEDEKNTALSAGVTYGADTAGAAAGALIVGALLVPVMGIAGTCIMAGVMNAVIINFIVLSYVLRYLGDPASRR